MDVCDTGGFNQFQRDGHKVKRVVFNSGMMPFSFCIIILIVCIHDTTAQSYSICFDGLFTSIINCL